LSKDYKDLGLTAEVVPYIKYISQLIKENKIHLQNKILIVQYHDSCYVGRYNNLFEEQRNIIKLLGGNLKEMEKHAGRLEKLRSIIKTDEQKQELLKRFEKIPGRKRPSAQDEGLVSKRCCVHTGRSG